MPLITWNCFWFYKQKNHFSENLLVLPRSYFHNRLTRFLAGGKWDFQVANLLLAIVDFEPCGCHGDHKALWSAGIMQ